MRVPLAHPYAEFITSVAKPARYLGGELNQVRKDWDSVEIHLALAFPDVYDVGMSHLGTRILYSLANRDERVACERCFAPWTDLERELRRRGLPLLSLESARPLSDFDVVGFSLQHELTFSNLLLMLELGGIPLRSEQRSDADPLVIAGGPNATHPEPVAPFIDAIVVGDGEQKLLELLHAWADYKREGLGREQGLRRLARLGGVYVPSLYPLELETSTGVQVVGRPQDPTLPYPVERAFVAEIDRYPFPADTPVPHAEAVFDRTSIEIARGCTEGCRFCQAGMIYRPVRERDPQQVLETVDGALASGGYDEVSLTSLSTADYSAIEPLVQQAARRLTPRKVALSVSSLRAYGLPEPVLDDISEVRAGGLTFAPEAGTQRMRDVISKNVTDEDMERTAHRVFSRGWGRAKLYFMLGLPSETDEDLRGIAETARKVREIGLEYHSPRRLKLTASVSSHVPKPHTPFQWTAFDPLDEVERKQRLLRGLAREYGFELKTHDARVSHLEAILARGDRRLADVIEQAYHAGARFDGWEEHFDHELWLRAFEACGVDYERYLGTLPVEARLAWDHLDVGLADGFLLKEYRKALANRLSPPCGKPFKQLVHHTNLEQALADERRLVCYDCGVACDLTLMREERIQFLRELGAEHPRQPRAAGIAAGEPAAVRRARRPQPGFEQGARLNLRLGYTKLGVSVLTGHLDLARALGRTVRRAGLEPFYSQGFKPKAVMTFGPALGLGPLSLNEWIDVALAAPPPPEVLERLNAAAPEGIHFHSQQLLEPNAGRLNRLASLAEYLVAVEAGALGADVEPKLVESVELALSKPGAVLVTTERRGERRERDLHGELLAARVCEHDRRALRCGIPVSARLFELLLPAQSPVRAHEALRALLASELEPLAVARVGLWHQCERGLADPLGRPRQQPAGRPPGSTASGAASGPAVRTRRAYVPRDHGPGGPVGA